MRIFVKLAYFAALVTLFFLTPLPTFSLSSLPFFLNFPLPTPLFIYTLSSSSAARALYLPLSL